MEKRAQKMTLQNRVSEYNARESAASLPIDGNVGQISLESVGYVTPLKKALLQSEGWVKLFRGEALTREVAVEAAAQLQEYLQALIAEGKISKIAKASDMHHVIDAEKIISEHLSGGISSNSLKTSLQLASKAELKSFRDNPPLALALSHAALIDIGALPDQVALKKNKGSEIDQARDGLAAAGVIVPLGYIHPNRGIQDLIQHYGDGFGRLGMLASAGGLNHLSFFRFNEDKNAAVFEFSGTFGLGARVTDNSRHKTINHRGAMNGEQVELMTAVALEKGWTHVSLHNVGKTIHARRKMEVLYAELTNAGLTVVGYEPTDRALRLLEAKQPLIVTPAEKAPEHTQAPSSGPSI